MKHKSPLILAGILVGALVLRVFWLGWSSLEHLEVTYLFEAVKPDSFWGVVTSRQSAEQMHQPLYPLFLRVWAQVSLNETWLRTPSVVFSLACVPLMYLLVRREVSEGAGLWAAALTAFSPLMVWYGRDASPYALLALFSLAAILLAQRALESGDRKPAAWAAVCLSGAFYTHFHGAWVCVLVGLWMLSEYSARRRVFWTTTGVTAVLCLPWLGPMLQKLLTSVQGLTEDKPLMRYSHDMSEALPEAGRLLFGGEHFTWLLVMVLAAVGAVLLVKSKRRLGRLVAIAIGVSIVAELHILWQLQQAKGIMYVDVRHYIWLAPVLAIGIAALPRTIPAGVVLVLQLWTAVVLVAQTPKPDIRAATDYVAQHATGPEHAIGFLPAPWYQPLVEYYLLGTCPGLVHGRSHEGWWSTADCTQYEKPRPGTLYGFPPTPERMHWSMRRQEVKFLWVIDIRDHRFGLPTPPTDPQERYHCWSEKEPALIRRKHFGEWVTVSLYDARYLQAAPKPPAEQPNAVIRTVTSAQAWELQCDAVP